VGGIPFNVEQKFEKGGRREKEKKQPEGKRRDRGKKNKPNGTGTGEKEKRKGINNVLEKALKKGGEILTEK